MRSMLLAGFVALTAMSTIAPAHAQATGGLSLRSMTAVSSVAPSLSLGTTSPSRQVRNGAAISNCFPVHKIANGFDYCTNTPILH